jgi:hypothetical protein
LVKDHLRGVGATEISICKSSMTLTTGGSGRSKGERDILSQKSLELLLTWGHLDKRRNLS